MAHIDMPTVYNLISASMCALSLSLKDAHEATVKTRETA